MVTKQNRGQGAQLHDDTQDSILVVDDSRAQRRLLASHLGRWGYHVVEASSGAEALEICRAGGPDLVVSDWMMPGLSGLEFCSKFKKIHADHYGYFILLTTKSEKGEVAQGLDVGADDFLTKPFNAAELRARIQAGQRILRMERELTEKNRLLSSTLAELQVLYDAIDQDLFEARKLQQSLVPERLNQYVGADVALLVQPAGHVGGDLVGVFSVNPDEIGVFSLDVSGHGIASALLTARLSALFSGSSPKQNIALSEDNLGATIMRAPSEVAQALNELFLGELETEHYFTLSLAKIQLKTGRTHIVQAGHPHPIVQRANGRIEVFGKGGLPIGLIEGATYTEVQVDLSPGDRLFLGSDGITECQDANGNQLDETGLIDLLNRNANQTGLSFFEALIWDLTSFADDRDFIDDISGALVEFHGRD